MRCHHGSKRAIVAAAQADVRVAAGAALVHADGFTAGLHIFCIRAVILRCSEDHDSDAGVPPPGAVDAFDARAVCLRWGREHTHNVARPAVVGDHRLFIRCRDERARRAGRGCMRRRWHFPGDRHWNCAFRRRPNGIDQQDAALPADEERAGCQHGQQEHDLRR